MAKGDDLISVVVAAETLKLGARQVQNLIKSGLLPAQLIGKSYVIRRSDLAKVPKTRKPGPKPKGKK